MSALAGPGFQPFAIAALVMGGLVTIEIVSTLLGLSFTEFLGKDLDLDHGLLGGLLGWVNPGGVPTLVLILVLLAGFSASGYAIQLASTAIWTPLPLIAAVPASGVSALVLSRWVTRAVARIIPSDETYAVSAEDLIGRVAEVTVGPLDQGPAGRMKVQDRYGNWHFPLSRAAEGHGPIEVGAQVLLVDRDSTAFIVIRATDALAAAQRTL